MRAENGKFDNRGVVGVECVERQMVKRPREYFVNRVACMIVINTISVQKIRLSIVTTVTVRTWVGPTVS